MKLQVPYAVREAGLVIAAALFAATATAADLPGRTLDCTTEIKFECDTDGCLDAEEGFADAERYRIDPAARHVTACLWSTCFGGQASAWTLLDGETRAVALLGSDGNDSYLALAFTLTNDGTFSATYSTGGRGTAVVFGTCN
jgi:hypothetical protein